MPVTYIPLSHAADELGISTNTLKRRFRALDLLIFRDTRDLRRRLVRRTDLEAAFGPPIPATSPPDVASLGPSGNDSVRCRHDG